MCLFGLREPSRLSSLLVACSQRLSRPAIKSFTWRAGERAKTAANSKPNEDNETFESKRNYCPASCVTTKSESCNRKEIAERIGNWTRVETKGELCRRWLINELDKRNQQSEGEGEEEEGNNGATQQPAIAEDAVPSSSRLT